MTTLTTVYIIVCVGEMAERSKAYAWRAYDEQNSSVGSNPTLSAIKKAARLHDGFFLLGIHFEQIEQDWRRLLGQR
ncbi:conserved protein of unknown function [Mesotoga infera]|uniref:Uncharacterized protein n=1 Tax=Mesotoga infera TaxID=1236046 RepID=A0A7Z7LHC5_9BACT|nr:conserved protein of unknown function [Mesotoga infera]